MVCKKIRLYDHRGEKTSHIGSIPRNMIDDLCDSRKTEVKIVQKMSEAHIVLGHFDENEISKIMKTSAGFNDFPDGQIVIFVTTTAGYTKYQNQKIVMDNKTRYLLFVQDMEVAKKPEILEKILTLTSEAAENILVEKSQEWPQGLFVSMPLLCLPALSVLCQGYLVVYSEHAKKKSPQMSQPEIKEVVTQKMKWTTSEPALAEHFSKVSQRNWWLEPFHLLDADKKIATDGWAEFMDRIQQEQRRVPDNDIIALLTHLKEGKLNEELYPDFPHLVAKAYCGIVKILESQIS